jgi:regulator of sigma E protease
MEILIKASQLILSLSILVVLHELGHFLPAKYFKMRVEKFYLFFDPYFSLFKLKKGDTEYGIGWIPLGGYVKIAGMIDESMDKEQMKKPAQEWEFRSKPAWQRLIVMVGGVTMNLILAVAIYAMLMFAFGEKYLPTANLKDGIWCADSLATEIGFQNGDKIISVDNKQIENFHDIVPEMLYASSVQVKRKGIQTNLIVPQFFLEKLIAKRKRATLIAPAFPCEVDSLLKGMVAETAGLKKGDKIIGVNNEHTEYFQAVTGQLEKNKGKTVSLKIVRGADTNSLSLPVSDEGKLGFIVKPLDSYVVFKTKSYSFLESFPAGIEKATEKLTDYIRQFKLIFDFKTGAYKGVGSFISIGNMFPAQWDWQSFWELTAILSIVLAFMNILPIPALDGGHVMFLLYEVITGKKPSDKFMEYAQYVGMAILLTMMVYAIGNDIFKLF